MNMDITQTGKKDCGIGSIHIDIDYAKLRYSSLPGPINKIKDMIRSN